MNFFIHPIESIEYIIRHNPSYGLIATFLIAFIESMAIIGSVVPGSITMGIIGSMVGAALLPLVPTAAIAFVGAYTGDIISFVIGKKCTNWIRSLVWVKKHSLWINKAEDFISKYGFCSIIIGRFFGPMRSMVPMLAGILKMNNAKFLIAAIPSAALWVLVYLIPGILIGLYYQELNLFSKQNLTIFAIVLLASIGVAFYYPRFSKKCSISYNNWLKSFGANGQIVHNRLIFCCFMSIFSWVYFFMVNHPSKYSLYHILASSHTHVLNYFMSGITLTSDKLNFIGIMIIILLSMKRKSALHLIISASLCLGLTYIFKDLLHIHRPPRIDTWNSFPSGHSIRISFILNYLYLCLNEKKQFWHKLIWFYIALVAISRLYLGAHWWPDVIAGIAFGTACAYFAHSFKYKIEFKANSLKKNLFAILVCSASLYAYKMPNYMYFFTHNTENKRITLNSWLKKTPIQNYLTSISGKAVEPLNINWLISPQAAKRLLSEQKWQVTDWPKTWISRLNKAITNPEIKFLPMIAKQYNFQVPVIVAYKQKKNYIHALILWQSNFKVGETPILVGNCLDYKVTKIKEHKVYKIDGYKNFRINDKNLITKQKSFARIPYKVLDDKLLALKLNKIFPRIKNASNN